MTNDTVHKSVLSDWVSKVFDFAPGTIIDATAGGGGHTEMLLDMGHKVIAVDRDPDVISRLATRFQGCSEVTLVQDTFSNIDKLGQVDGVLADLGFSSDQMDDHTRGFSFMSDSPPDMRMSQQGETAQELIEQSTDQELTDLIRQYSEEKKAWPIAKRIAGRRFESCRDLAAEIGEIAPDKRPWKQKWRKINPATKTFQALRIAVNDELKELERLLELLPEIILP
ncbi:MAG: 16S rRNA (cytosine(1402)-N(4))-methyltransferase RsmH, partial [Candidatus Lindowbacteria bacterium]|nr:16S rRNA (cytosine(1402)-N(4))-methyltransferase RsmH [Candidatus Lindowbacteria bacterium]